MSNNDNRRGRLPVKFANETVVIFESDCYPYARFELIVYRRYVSHFSSPEEAKSSFFLPLSKKANFRRCLTQIFTSLVYLSNHVFPSHDRKIFQSG